MKCDTSAQHSMARHSTTEHSRAGASPLVVLVKELDLPLRQLLLPHVLVLLMPLSLVQCQLVGTLRLCLDGLRGDRERWSRDPTDQSLHLPGARPAPRRTSRNLMYLSISSCSAATCGPRPCKSVVQLSPGPTIGTQLAQSSPVVPHLLLEVIILLEQLHLWPVHWGWAAEDTLYPAPSVATASRHQAATLRRWQGECRSQRPES